MDNSNHKSSKLIVEVGAKINEESFKEVERRFKKLLDMSIQINKLREEIEGEDEALISKRAYEVLTKDKYIECRLCGINPCNISKETKKILQDRWDKLRKGYEFVILVGDMIYSVDYFNELLGEKREFCIINADTISGHLSIQGFKGESTFLEDEC